MAAPQGLLVQQQMYPSGGGSLEAINGRPPAKQGSIQSVDTVSMQYSDPSEDAAAALASSASMQSRPGSKVRASISIRADGSFACTDSVWQCSQAGVQLLHTCLARSELPPPSLLPTTIYGYLVEGDLAS